MMEIWEAVRSPAMGCGDEVVDGATVRQLTWDVGKKAVCLLTTP
jgi:hypothetical protein